LGPLVVGESGYFVRYGDFGSTVGL
jgi:hypothetical protein